MYNHAFGHGGEDRSVSLNPGSSSKLSFEFQFQCGFHLCACLSRHRQGDASEILLKLIRRVRSSRNLHWMIWELFQCAMNRHIPREKICLEGAILACALRRTISLLATRVLISGKSTRMCPEALLNAVCHGPGLVKYTATLRRNHD